MASVMPRPVDVPKIAVLISVDYRMPPDLPYPAAMEDAMAVWAATVKTTDPRKCLDPKSTCQRERERDGDAAQRSGFYNTLREHRVP